MMELTIHENGNEYTLIVTHENAQRAVNGK